MTHRLSIVLALLCLVGTAQAEAQGSGSATLDATRNHGQLSCGVGGAIAGYSLPDSKGVMQGLDADTCRAVAAAVFGDPGKLKFTSLSTENRFTALQSGEVDLLARTTTWTLGREGNLGLLFAWVTFYDGTGFLVKTSAGVPDMKALDGATVCVQPGTSTELAVADYFRHAAMTFTPILIDDLSAIHEAFISGRCDAFASDSSQLAGFRASQGERKADYVLLPGLISEEPLGPMVRKGDDKWFDVVRWSMIAMLAAEEEGITSRNIDTFMDSKDPAVRRLLGLEGDMGKALGLDDRWAYNVIKTVGNFGEVWDRDIAPLGIPRGVNNLWDKGGLQYPPPIR